MDGKNVFSDILTLVLDIFPGNLLAPFTIDNDMQVIVIAIFVGVVMLGLGDKIQRIRKIFEEASTLINRMMLVVCKLLPLLVYFGFSNILLSDNLSKLADVSKIVIISLVGAAITIGITIIRAVKVTKVPFKELFKAQLPSLLINLTTSSQVAALPESMKCCKEKWGIDKRLVDFGLPFGVVFYMPNGAIMLGSIVWGLAAISVGPIDPVTLTKLIFVSVIVAIAAPPIPGSAFAVLPILFSACGTDLSLMPLAIIVGSTVGYLLPAMNGFCLQLELFMTARKFEKT
jgi:Na+/H+-dicarboxylate symporter